MKTSKSPRKVLLTAYAAARESLPAYAHRFSPRKFTQHQLFACLVLKTMLDLDYRGVAALLQDAPELRADIGMEHVPHFTTLQKASERLLLAHAARKLHEQTLRLAEECKVLAKETTLAAIDSSGFESRHTSPYFVKRRERGQKDLKNPLYQTSWYHPFPKLALVIDCRSHLIIAAHPTRGPSPDFRHVDRLMTDAFCRRRIRTILADAGYDAEWVHRFCRLDLSMRSIIPPRIGRPTAKKPTGRYRAMMHRRFPKKTYGQRWQVECVFSMIKRLQGSALHARSYWAQHRAMLLKSLTHNVMILRRRRGGFLQSTMISLVRRFANCLDGFIIRINRFV
jgi:transposase